ncbi:MAG: carbamoyl-phosphate synthase subunit L [Acidobacteria bacterium]|nr:MAG: carbamoyl-phosphate synthase subunit L [Acidobacteriota bacterium]
MKMELKFKRVAIINRGEPAMRAIHAIREYNLEHGTDIKSIAFHVDSDKNALFYRKADESYSIGDATFLDPRDGVVKPSYLNYNRLEQALKQTKADAVWAGWGFVAEHAEFVDLCEKNGMTFIGPSATVMRKLGDKISSKKYAALADVPLAAWSEGEVSSLEEAKEQAHRLGYPLMIKASAGGGGRGIRMVDNEEELVTQFDIARQEALKYFGDGRVFLERRIENARHVEVQMIGDQHGTIWAMGVRDCSIQRHFQKIMEESPSPVLTAEEEQTLRRYATDLCKQVNYENVGTIEFLFEPQTRNLYFLEVNTRLQVEHPITELTTGLDLVKTQFFIARGGRLEGEAPVAKGHAIEVRLNAEDPALRFAASPGLVEKFRFPAGPGVRIDTGIMEGDAIPAEFDSNIAKIMAYGRNRNEALARLKRVLAQMFIIIRGGASNKGFLCELLDMEEVRHSDYHTLWLDELVQEDRHMSHAHADVAILQAGIEDYLTSMETETARFLNSAKRGRPELRKDSGVDVELEYHNHNYAFSIYRLGVYHFRIDMQGKRIYLRLEPLGGTEWNLTIGSERFRIHSLRLDHNYWVQVEGVPYRISRSQGSMLRAPAPAVVASVLVKEGDRVKAGDRLIVMEAMKMEMALTASYSGTIVKVLVRNYMQVPPQEPLILIEPDRQKQPMVDSGNITFDRFGPPIDSQQDTQQKCAQNMEELKSLIRGFDEDASEIKRLMEERSELCHFIPADDLTLMEKEDELLTIFVDFISLFRSDPSIETEGPLSTQEYLLAFLVNPEEGMQLMPESFITKLKRALLHYDIQDIQPSPDLDFGLFRISKSHQRMAQQVAPILSILERRLENVDVLKKHVDETLMFLLDRLIIETQDRFPKVNELAIQVRYHYFTKPLLEKALQQDLDQVNSSLAFLEKYPQHERRQKKIQTLVGSPLSLMTHLTVRFSTADLTLRQVMLEVMMRRYYRLRELKNIQTRIENGQCLAMADYNYEGKRYHVITTYVNLENFSRGINNLRQVIKGLPKGDEVMIDFYTEHQDPESLMPPMEAFLNRERFPKSIYRIFIGVAIPNRKRVEKSVRLFTYYRDENGAYAEQLIYRDLHPIIYDRLHINRLQHFEIERLPSIEDVYLFRGTAHSNPKDRRLFAFAEIRDLTIVRRSSGNRISLPSLERTLMEIFSSMRDIQSQQPLRQRFVWNRIYLYVWPVFDLQLSEIKELVSRLVRATRNLAIEKVVVRVLRPQGENGELKEQIIDISNPAGGGLVTQFKDPIVTPIQPLTAYTNKVVKLQQRGMVYPYELIKMLTPSADDTQSKFPPGSFQEYDLDDQNKLVPVHREPGLNTANIIVGVITNTTLKYPEGMKRVILLGDPSRAMGSLAEPECRRINEGLELARKLDVPVEWMAVSAGALISMQSGTENMDWIGLTLRKIIEFTQEGRNIHIVVNGITVGAQPYFNAEATMLMHTKGILIMTPKGSMVLTGKRALDYSGGVSAEDNLGIGGYERVMGPNGQAQYFARNIGEACNILFQYYEHSYRLPGERFPRSKPTDDPISRDICNYPHGNSFKVVGEIFSDETNPGRKRPFEIRKVMQATVDQDHKPLERWFGMQDAEIAVVWDAHVGGIPVCMLGFESQPLRRLRFVPADGPANWTSGTLFPLASKKIARSINSASNNRPLVVLANLSGFDGSPESMRQWQLENGAEIGRAVVNFKGPIVFVVISRYHGGAFVVFSNALNDNMEVIALEGTYASVIGGSPAAAVVFAREVAKQTKENPQIKELEKQIATAKGAKKVRLRAQWNDLYEAVHSEELGKMATKFDSIHSVQRAEKVGSVDKIIPASKMRPYIVERLKALMAKELNNQ